VEIDAPIQQYLPWFQPNMPMTVRQLLNQTSGLDEGQGYERNLDPDGEDALEQSIRQLATTALNNQPPGTAFEYSNSNYDVLGLLVESVSGQPYGTYMQDNLFEPLSMTHSFTSLEAARMAGMSSAFYPLFGWQTNVDGILPYSRSTQPSAGLIGSVEDMAHYLIAHLNNGRFQNNQLLSPASIETLHSPAVTIGSDAGAVDYAMGWVAWLFEDAVQDKTAVPPTALSHGGAWLGFQHIMLLIPEKELGMVLLLNSNDPSQSSAYSNIAFDVTLLALGLDAQNYPPQEDMLTRYLRPLSLTVILLLLIGGWVALRRLRGHVLTIRDRWFFMGLTMIDLGLIVYLLGIRLPNNNSSVPLVLRFEPDLGVMLVIVLLLTAVWGSIRTLYVLHRWWGQARAGIR
jgi:CubicO group peptidase (beta-lactamase class C family)